MFAELVDGVVWTVRAALFAGLCWGAWLSFGPGVQPASSPQKMPPVERFAMFALLVLLLTTLGAIVDAG